MAKYPAPGRAESSTALAPSMFTAAQWDHVVRSLRLTPQQARVAALILKGMPDKQIAAEMELCVATVRTHLRGIYGCLGVAGRMELALRVLSIPRDDNDDGRPNHL